MPLPPRPDPPRSDSPRSDSPRSDSPRPDPARLTWERDGQDWPNRAASRFVTAGGIDWHVQVAGEGPALLLLHGSGAASHSWGGLLPLLSTRFTVIAPDLPGHGFTAMPAGGNLTLPRAARLVAALLAALDLPPRLALGHSAGAAILLRMALDGLAAPAGIVSLNGALLPFRGLAGALLPPMARLMHHSPFAPRLMSLAAIDPSAVPLMIRGTGSRIDRQGLALYAKLFRNRAHVAGTLGMMAGWELEPLGADLPRLALPLLLIAAERDRAVPPSQAVDIAERVPGARLLPMPGLGHLAHEEAPERIAAPVLGFARDCGVLAG